MAPSPHPLAAQPLPPFIPPPGGIDYWLVGVGIFLLVVVALFGSLYLRLHHLPDHIAHRSQKVQYGIVGVLGLLAMFTHINAFWVAALLLALIDIPDFASPLSRMAGALERIAARRHRRPAMVIGSDQIRDGARVARRDR